MGTLVDIPGLGRISDASGFVSLEAASDGIHRVGTDGVRSVTATGDRKVEFIAWADHTLAYVKSAMGYPAYYRMHPVSLDKPVEAVLMDLDGTSVRSEHFWIWMIELSTASLRNERGFRLADDDVPYVSGHSV